jgi:hypothetical protein
LLKIIIKNKLTQIQQHNRLITRYLANFVSILLLSSCGGRSGGGTGGSGSSVAFSTPVFSILFFLAVLLVYKKLRDKC